MRDWNREVVVTGMGVCCHLGDDLPEIEQKLRQGKSEPFLRWQEAVDMNARCQLMGMYEGDVSDAALGIDKKQARFMGRAARLALKATRSAVAQAEIDPTNCAVVVGTGTGDVDTHNHIQRRLNKTADSRKVGPTVIPKLMASTASANIVNVLRTQGPSMSATAACAGGAYNLLMAAQLLEHGHADCAIAGGVEGRDIHFYAGFDAMRAFNSEDNERPERASRPYAADRGGFIFGEGAGIVILETLEHARARGAQVLGSLRGFGMSTDGQGEMVAPDENGAHRALMSALRHAELDPSKIDYVNTHGTSTPLGDISEVRAIRRALDGRHIPYSSTKGYTGHAISGAGAIEAIFCLLMLRGGWVAPCVHADPLDPALNDYPPVREPTNAEMRYALSNSFGFGGTNACLVLARDATGSAA